MASRRTTEGRSPAVAVLASPSWADSTAGTVCLAVVTGRQAYLASVGDSRGYLLRGEELRQLTVDHTRAQMLLERGRITAEQAQTHPDRHSLTRAVGVEPTVDIAYSTAGLEPEVIADAVLYALSQPDNVDVSDLGVRPSLES